MTVRGQFYCDYSSRVAPPDPQTVEHIKNVNVRYHDAAASSYDAKWGIDYGPTGQAQVRAKLGKALGRWAGRPFGDALEIGAGTGYFSLNLLQLGLIERATATDISSGMLAELGASAGRLGLEVSAVETDAERLPFESDSFDLVFGHAVLHHIPALELALAEMHRVLRRGGTLAFCGEPSRYGDLFAAAPKRYAHAVAPVWRRAVGVPAKPDGGASATRTSTLERQVDVHAFAPGRLHELLANMYGWILRAWESTADPDRVPWAWQSFAFRSYLALQRVDATLLEPNLPPSLFYNLVLSARRG